MIARLEKPTVGEGRFLTGAHAAALVAVSFLVGIAVAAGSPLAVLPLAALGGALLLVDGRVRIVFVVFGGLLVLQRGEGLDLTKLLFFAGAGISFVGAFVNVQRLRRTAVYELARPLLAVTVAFFALGAISFAVADWNGIGLVAWLRDVVPYLLFASAPIFALDAQASLGRKGLVRVLVLAGTLAAVLFAVYWLQRRYIADLGLGSLGLASIVMPAAIFAYAMSKSLEAERGRTRWLLLAAFVAGVLIVTGTRTTFVLLLAPIAIAVAVRHNLARRSVRLALLGPLALGVTLIFGLAVVGVSGADTEYLEKRLDVLRSTGDSSGDASYNERLHQSEVAWERFRSAMILGSGPGTTFEWKTQDGFRVFSSFLDTPLTFPAKFGLLGLAFLAFAVASYRQFLRRLRRRGEPGIAHLALVGYLAVVVAISPLVLPFDDKGFSFGLILVLALALQEARAAAGRSTAPAQTAA